MKFLLDQDVYATTLHFLSELGHDVIPVSQIGLAQATDEDLLKTAQDQNRIFVTRDRDFGQSCFCQRLRCWSSLLAYIAFNSEFSTR